MKKLLVALAFLLHGVSFAECPHTFTCTQQGCFKVADNSCSLPAPVVYSQDKDGKNNQTNQNGAVFASPSTNQTQTPSSGPARTYGCAENGSCYGDTSLINGMPKTINVDGYYRKDGTYVRGHYRSKGR
jgi:hypothetical protein